MRLEEGGVCKQLRERFQLSAPMPQFRNVAGRDLSAKEFFDQVGLRAQQADCLLAGEDKVRNKFVV